MYSQPGSADYPSTALLHAICAVAAFYTKPLGRGAMPDMSSRPEYEMFRIDVVLSKEQGLAPDAHRTFAVEQASLAKLMLEHDFSQGKHLLDAAAASAILGLYEVRASWLFSHT
jgi:hypothetical protein